MKLNLLVITAFVLGAVPFSLQARAVEPAAPSTQPSAGPTDEVAALIGQLGDDDFRIRLDAAGKLKAMGPSVFPALKDACKSDDPEVHARIEDILHIASDVPQPSAPGKQVMHASIANGTRIVEIQEPGRTIHIEQGSAGISLTVTGQLAGQQVTREFKARTPEQLRRDNPQAFDLFQKFAGNGNILQFGFGGNGVRINGNLNVRVNAINVGNRMAGVNGGVVVVPLGARQDKLLEQLRARNLAGANQQEVQRLLKQLRDEALPANALPKSTSNNGDRQSDRADH